MSDQNIDIGKLYRVRFQGIIPAQAELAERLDGKTVLVIADADNRALKDWYKCLFEESYIWMHKAELEAL